MEFFFCSFGNKISIDSLNFIGKITSSSSGIFFRPYISLTNINYAQKTLYLNCCEFKSNVNDNLLLIQ